MDEARSKKNEDEGATEQQPVAAEVHVPAWQSPDANPIDQVLAAVSEAVQPVVDQLVILEAWLTRTVDGIDARRFNGTIRRGLGRLGRLDLVAVASSRTLFWVLCGLTALLLGFSFLRSAGGRGGAGSGVSRAMLQGYGVEHDSWSGGAEWERNAEDAAEAEGSRRSGSSALSGAGSSNLKLSTAIMHVSHDCDFSTSSPLFVVSSLDGLIEGSLGLGATFTFDAAGRLDFGPSAGSRFGALAAETEGGSGSRGAGGRGNIRARKGGAGAAKDRKLPLFVIYGEPAQWSRAVSPDVRQMFRALLNVYGWRTFLPRRIGRARVSYSSWEALNVDLEVAFGRRPDVLLFIGSVASWLPALGRRYVRKGILNSRVWVFAEDVHWHSTDERKGLLSLYSRADVLVSPYAYLLHDLFPEIASTVPVKWVPHAAGIGHMLPANANAVPKVLVTGPLKGSRWQRYADVVTQLLAQDQSPLLHVSAVRQQEEEQEEEGEDEEEAVEDGDEGSAPQAEEEADTTVSSNNSMKRTKNRSEAAAAEAGRSAVAAAAEQLAGRGGGGPVRRSRGRSLAALAGRHAEIEAAYAAEEEEQQQPRRPKAPGGSGSRKRKGSSRSKPAAEDVAEAGSFASGPALVPTNTSLYVPSAPPAGSRTGLAIAGWSHAVALGRHLACLVDGLILNYAVAKVFEIPATGCLLLVNEEMEPIMEKLGFIAMRHYLPYTATTLRSVVDAVLDPANRPAVDEMRRAGQRLVWARHMTTHRAATLHDFAVADAEAGHRDMA